MAGMIDYAGLFPPAKLPLDAAIRNYATYRAQPESWMLGRFICPAARLGELADVGRELFAEGEPFRISALGRGGATAEESVSGVEADLADVASFRKRCGDCVVLDAYETRLPASCSGVIDATTKRFERQGPAGVSLSFEVPPIPAWDALLVGVTAELLLKKPVQRRSVARLGVKLRCGGVEATAFPSVEQVTLVIVACREAGVPLKCTAGLHHPVRHYNDSVNTKMHGFLNVFGAGILAHAVGMDRATIREVIADESPDSFAFDADGFRWKEHRATVAQIEAARASAMLSFGSCSFDEPRDDLRALGLM
jgi:hypothetical protein